MSLPHWEYFLAIESDLEKCSRYVEFCQDNDSTYSLEFARIIMASCSETDTIIKLLCKAIDPGKRPDNILEYFPVLSSKYPKFTTFEIFIPRFKIRLHPWKDWTETKSPDWWSKAYNKIKHERDKFFKEANLTNTLNAVSGLFCVILYYYKATPVCARIQKHEKVLTFMNHPALGGVGHYSSWNFSYASS